VAVNDEVDRPAAGEARRAMDDFLDAAQWGRLTTDARLVELLSAHARRAVTGRR
jgi:hypothetical protein